MPRPGSRRRRNGLPNLGTTVSPAASSPSETRGSGRGGTGRLRATAASRRMRPAPSSSTISQRAADTVAASMRPVPKARYSIVFTRSSPIHRAAPRRPAAWRTRHRAMSPGTRPHAPRPHMVTAWRTSVPPPAAPWLQRRTAQRPTRPCAKPSPTWRAAWIGSRGTRRRRAITLPEPSAVRRGAASRRPAGLGRRPSPPPPPPSRCRLRRPRPAATGAPPERRRTRPPAAPRGASRQPRPPRRVRRRALPVAPRPARTHPAPCGPCRRFGSRPAAPRRPLGFGFVVGLGFAPAAAPDHGERKPGHDNQHDQHRNDDRQQLAAPDVDRARRGRGGRIAGAEVAEGADRGGGLVRLSLLVHPDRLPRTGRIARLVDRAGVRLEVGVADVEVRRLDEGGVRRDLVDVGDEPDARRLRAGRKRGDGDRDARLPGRVERTW